jgi:hypothetical protein
VGIRKIQVPPPLFALFDPFKTDLWLAIAVFSVAYGLVLFALHRAAARREGAETRPSVREAAQIQYHSLVMVLGGEEFDAWRSTSLRIARVGMLLFVLVFGATYAPDLGLGWILTGY